MNRITLKSRVSEDGTLRLSLPLGAQEAGHDVQVTVEPFDVSPPMTSEAWQAWVTSMAGSWQGEFERSPQGDFEQRDPFP